MIRNLSETLRAILTQPGLPAELAAARITFDAPVNDPSPAQTEVNLFLYDIRENNELRLTEPIVKRQNGQALVQPPPLRVACSYLVTAWPAGGTELTLQQHRLLSQVLQAFARFPTVPAPFLQGSLVGQEPPVPLMTAQMEGLKNPAEFWSALGTKLRPSLTIVATVSIPVTADTTAPLVTTVNAGFDLGRGVIEETLVEIGGRVRGPTGQPLADAYVEIVDLAKQTRTDENGQFKFDSVPTGAHTVRAVAVGFNPKTQPLVVPGRPEDYEISLTLL